MEKKKTVSLNWPDIIKYAVMLIMIGSAYATLVTKNSEQDKRIDTLEKENIELRKVSEKVAEINGKQDIIIKYVEAITHRLDSDHH